MIAEYTWSLEMDPRFAEAYNNRGLTYGERPSLTRPSMTATWALKINPRLAGAYNNLGFAYDLKGQYDQAITDFTGP